MLIRILLLLLICLNLPKEVLSVLCFNCTADNLNCGKQCEGSACLFSIKSPIEDESSKNYGCTDKISTNGCTTNIITQEVSCYCTSDNCNSPLTDDNEDRLKRFANKYYGLIYKNDENERIKRGLDTGSYDTNFIVIKTTTIDPGSGSGDNQELAGSGSGSGSGSGAVATTVGKATTKGGAATTAKSGGATTTVGGAATTAQATTVGAATTAKATSGAAATTAQATTGAAATTAQATTGGAATTAKATSGGAATTAQANSGGAATTRQATSGGAATTGQATSGGAATTAQANSGGAATTAQASGGAATTAQANNGNSGGAVSSATQSSGSTVISQVAASNFKSVLDKINIQAQNSFGGSTNSVVQGILQHFIAIQNNLQSTMTALGRKRRRREIKFPSPWYQL